MYEMLEPAQKYSQAFCTPEDIATAEEIRKFVDAELMPRRHDLEGGWHRDEALARKTVHSLYAKLVDLGVTKSNLPEKFGGLGLSPMVRTMINEELSRADIGLATMVGKIHWIVSFMLAGGRDDLLEELAPKIIGDESWTACVAITEPAGGANIEDPALEFQTLRVVAKEEGDEYVINGHKLWPGPSGPADYFKGDGLSGHLGYWTVATTDPKGGRDCAGLFYVPADAEGLEFSRPYQKMGFSWSDSNGDIWFRNVRIPRRYRIDTKPGQGADIIKACVVGLGRLSGSARLIGLSQAVLEIVLDWGDNRSIAGTKLRERSMFAGYIAEMFRAIEVCRHYYMSVTWQVTRPEIYGAHHSPQMMARFSAARSLAGETAQMVTNKAMELMGAFGYSYEGHVEKYMRDYKIAQLWLGGPQRERLDIAQGLYGPFRWGGQDKWEAEGGKV